MSQDSYDNWSIKHSPRNTSTMRNQDSVSENFYTPVNLLWAAVVNRALLDFKKICDGEVTILHKSVLHHYSKELLAWLSDFESDHVGSFRFACEAAKFSASTIENIRQRVAKDAVLLGL